MAGSSVVGALHVTLGLDSAQFEKGLKNAQDKLAGFDVGRGLESGLKQIEDRLGDTASEIGGFGTVLSSLGGAGLAAAAALGGVALALDKTKEAIAEAAEFGKLAKTVGTSTDFIQKFNFAARQSDVEVGAADAALKGLNESLGAVQGNLPRAKQLAAVFQLLGFSPDQLRQFQSVEDFFPVLAQRISETGNAAEQAAIAKKLGIEELLPLLKDGSEGFNSLAKAASDLGVVMSASTIAQAKEAKEKLTELDQVMKAQKDITFAQYADTLVSLATAWHKVEEAGFHAITALTHTQPLSVKIQEAQYNVDHADAYAAQIGLGAASPDLKAHLKKQLNDLELQDLNDYLKATPAKEGPAKPLPSIPNKSGHSTTVADDTALAAAQKAELAAQIALTGDIDQLANLRAQEIDTETQNANRKIQDEVKEKKISQSTADRVVVQNDLAENAKLELNQRQRIADLAQRAAQNEAQFVGYGQRIASAEAQMAGTAEERARLEEASLAARQRSEFNTTKAALDAEVVAKKKSQAEADSLLVTLAEAQTAERELKRRQDADAIAKEALDRQKADLQDQSDILASSEGLAKSTTARADIEIGRLKLAQQQEILDQQAIIDSKTASDAQKAEAEKRLKDLAVIHTNQLQIALAETSVYKRMSEAADAASGLKSAIASHDWAGIFDQMQRAVQTVEAAFQNQGLSGGLASLGAIAATTLGGKTGSALGTGITASVIAGGVASALTGAGFLAGGGLFGGSALGSALLGAAAFTGPLAPVIGLVAGLATLFTNTKPSNFTASAAFNGTSGVSLGGDKPNSSTTSLAQQAANSLLQAEQTLKAAGVTLTTTVAGLEIGQRDPSKITLSNGQVLNSGVGDASAAVDTALKAVLRGAQFTDQAEQKLVNSMLDAGKGFDDVVSALNNYQAAQAALTNVTNQIQQLTDPQAYDLGQVKANIDTQKKAAQAAADAGYITADQLSQVNAQLDRLSQLQIDQVMAKYGDAVAQAAAQQLAAEKATAAAAQQAADQQVQDAQAALSAARQAEAATLQTSINQFTQVASSLTQFASTLLPNALANISSYLNLSAQFDLTAAQARLGDLTAASSLATVGQQFLTVSKTQAKTLADFQFDQAKVRAGALAAADTATRQASIAQQQLDQLNATVDQLLGVNNKLLSVVAAIDALTAAEAGAAVAYQNALAAAQATDAQAAATVATVQVTSPDLSAASDTSAIAASASTLTAAAPDTSSAVAAQVAQLLPALQAVVMNTRVFADYADQWNAVGIPTVAAP